LAIDTSPSQATEHCLGKENANAWELTKPAFCSSPQARETGTGQASQAHPEFERTAEFEERPLMGARSELNPLEAVIFVQSQYILLYFLG
jgi:hypothetical protein